jgi:uncharacterized protein
VGLFGRDETFFDQFDAHARITLKGAGELLEMVSTGRDLAAAARRIKALEHQADDITHRCLETLHRAFSLPVDRRAAYRLISRMDDVLDHVESAAERIVLYELVEMRPDARALADTVNRSAVELSRVLRDLRVPRRRDDVLARCIEINRIENQADELLRASLAQLFRSRVSPIDVIKWKEIYEELEEATDRCEDAANVIEGLVLEQV